MCNTGFGKVVHGEVGQVVDVRRITPRGVAGKVGRKDMDLGLVFTDAVHLAEEFGYIGDVLDHIIHPDFFHAVVFEWQLLG